MDAVMFIGQSLAQAQLRLAATLDGLSDADGLIDGDRDELSDDDGLIDADGLRDADGLTDEELATVNVPLELKVCMV